MSINRAHASNSFSMGEFVFFVGTVEDRMDPLMLGRHRVRAFGFHSKEKSDIATDQLFWASSVGPIVSASLSGIGVSPTGILPGTQVFGFFLDGHNAQNPWIIGTLWGRPEKAKPSEGFHDPKGKYPTYDAGEQDTNRLARNEKTDKTCYKKRVDGLDLGVKIAFSGTWDEKKTPYAAKYPYNHVRETESGHVEEFDDTEGKERYLLWHKIGNFTEIHNDGVQVEKVKDDHYLIVEKTQRVHIKKDFFMTVDGDYNLLVKGNQNIEIMGEKREEDHQNSKLKVGINYEVDVGSVWLGKAGSLIKFNAPLILLNT